MTLLALTIKAHTGIRLAEVGEALGAIAGLALLLGGITPDAPSTAAGVPTTSSGSP